MRLACGIAHHSGSFCENCSHEYILCGCDRCFIEKHLRSPQYACTRNLEIVIFTNSTPTTKRLECEEMGVQTPEPNDIPPWRWKHKMPPASNQRSCQKKRCSDSIHQVGREWSLSLV